jgi:hypothetical protein
MIGLKDQFRDVIRTTLPISIFILVLNTATVGAAPIEFCIEVLCIAMVIIGFALFLYGVEVGVLPMGKAVGLQMARSGSIPIIVGMVFLIGIVVTIAEPDVTVFTTKVDTVVNELNGTALAISIALGVASMMVVAALRMVYHVNLKLVLAIGYAIVVILGFGGPQFILGIAFDSGGVTTGPITIPVMMAMGMGIGFMASKGGNQMNNFGMVGLASIGPLITVMVYGYLTGLGEVTTIPPVTHVDPVGIDFFVKMFKSAGNDTVASVVPLYAIFVLILRVYLHCTWHDIRILSISLIFTASGMILFLTGVYSGFMPLAEEIGVYLVQNDAGIWILVVGAIFSFLTIAAEPALKILGNQVETVSKGALKRSTITNVVGIGVSVFVGVGMYLMSQGLSSVYWILVLYVVAIVLLFFMDDKLVGVAYDAGGVATGPMSVAIIMSMYAIIAEAIGGDVAQNNAFGAIALIALSPIVALSVMGIIVRLKKGHNDETATNGES